MDMFKALDIWMAELEEEFYEDYMRAHNALEDWKNAKRAMVRDVDVWDIRDSLKGNYRGYCCLIVTKRYREEVVTRDGVDWVFLIDTVTIDDNDYEVVVANAKAKGQEDVRVSWSVERNVEDIILTILVGDCSFSIVELMLQIQSSLRVVMKLGFVQEHIKI